MSMQWCAGRVTVNKVVDRQKVRPMVNKLTVTFDQVTIIGNDLSASFGMVTVVSLCTARLVAAATGKSWQWPPGIPGILSVPQ